MTPVLKSCSLFLYAAYPPFKLMLWVRTLSASCKLSVHMLFALWQLKQWLNMLGLIILCLFAIHTSFSWLFYYHFHVMKLQAKIPDIEKCLDVVATLQSKKGTGEVCSQTCNCLLVYNLFTFWILSCKLVILYKYILNYFKHVLCLILVIWNSCNSNSCH